MCSIYVMAAIFLTLLQNYGNRIVTYSNTNANEKEMYIWNRRLVLHTNISYEASIEVQKKFFIIEFLYQRNFFGDIPFRFELYHLSCTKKGLPKELLHL